MIPAEAVEAAAKALKARCGAWDSWAVLARTALEAAAPHMMGDGERKTTTLRLNDPDAKWEEL